MNYKITAIIPVFNGEKDLKKCVESIINQTFGFENIELIIVDDCSTDNTANIIKHYQNKYDNIKGIFLEENSGHCGKPRNEGIEIASAEYIIFADADDEYLPHAFELYYNTIIKEHSDFVLGSHFWNLGGKLMKINILHYSKDQSDVININPSKDQLSFNKLSHYHVAAWGKIYSKELLMSKNIRFPEDCICEDAIFYFNLLLNSSKVTLLPNDQLYMYYCFDDEESMIHGHDYNKFNSFLISLYKLFDVLKDCKFSKQLIISENIGYLLLMLSNIEKKYKKEAILKIYEFEQTLDEEIIVSKKEIDFLNKLILNRHFTLAIFVSDLYSILYNNKTIKYIYRKFNNKRD